MQKLMKTENIKILKMLKKILSNLCFSIKWKLIHFCHIIERCQCGDKYADKSTNLQWIMYEFFFYKELEVSSSKNFV